MHVVVQFITFIINYQKVISQNNNFQTLSWSKLYAYDMLARVTDVTLYIQVPFYAGLKYRLDTAAML